MSKRALNKLVDDQIVRGWDDPRLYTLVGLRRRGIPPGAILSFINELGVTTARTVIQIARFEQSVRRYLETTVPRLMLILDPIPVVIVDLDELEGQELDIPFSPKDPKMGSHKLKLTKTVYIDRTDFREIDSKDYFRLAIDKSVGLLHVPFPIKAISFSKDEATEQVTEVRAVLDKQGKKPKAYIQWVPEGSRKVEVRVHGSLFKSDDPTAVEGGFMNDLNLDSETVYTDALVETGFEEVRRRAPWPEAAGEATSSGPEGVRFQALRVAYFVS
jgi:glutaminyl-tRNA synthetase